MVLFQNMEVTHAAARLHRVAGKVATKRKSKENSAINYAGEKGLLDNVLI